MPFFSAVRSRSTLLLLCLLLLLALHPLRLSAQTVPASSPIGVIVESVTPGSSADKAGLRVGDVLLWYADRPLQSAFGFLAAQENILDAALVKIKGRRGNQEIEVQVPRRAPGLQVRPVLSPAVLSRYEAREAETQKGHKEAAETAWGEAVNLAKEAGDHVGAGWLCWRSGEACAMRGAWKEAQEWQARAWEFVQNENDPAAQARIRRALGITYYFQQDASGTRPWIEEARQQNAANDNKIWEADNFHDLGELAHQQKDWKAAESWYKQAIPLRRRQESDSLDLAIDLSQLGLVLEEQKKFIEAFTVYKQALTVYEQALTIAQEQEANSYKMALIFHNMTIVAYGQKAWEKAEGYGNRALVIYRREKDASKVMATLKDLGTLALLQEKFSETRKYCGEALPFYKTHSPNTFDTAIILHNLGVAAQKMDDLLQAEKYSSEARLIIYRCAPGFPNESASLINLGAIAVKQGEITKAKEYFTRARDIDKPFINNPLASVSERAQAADDYIGLGVIAAIWGDMTEAKEECKQALTILHKLTPFSQKIVIVSNLLNLFKKVPDNEETDDAVSHQSLAIARKLSSSSLEETWLRDKQSLDAAAHSHWKEAQKSALESLAVREKQRPGSLYVMTSHNVLGYIAQKQGNLPAAQQHFEKALAITRTIAPGSFWHTLALGSLGNNLLARHKPGKALPHLIQATDLIERQRQQISTPESRALLLEQYADPFTGLMEAQIALGRKEDAFTTLERTRARSLVEMLNTRDARTRFMAGADVPSSLRKQQQELDKQRARQTRRWYINPGRGESKLITAEIQRLDSQQRELEAAIYRVSPRYASLQYPTPLSFAQAQKTLDEGTLLLAYALGEKKCYLFALTRTTLKIYPLAVDKPMIVGEVKQLLEALQAQGSYQAAARKLYHDMIWPAQDKIKAAKRLLICPDGVLHTLPFAALVTSKAEQKSVRHLIEEKPLHTVVSLGLYHQLRITPVSHTGTILALADPDRSTSDIAPANSSASKEAAGRQPLEPLPQTRRQIETLQKLYGARVQAREGKQATPAALRKDCSQANVIHLACHGIANKTAPLASALALSPDGKDSGWLTAYDILGLKIRANLVMLSACDTGVGKPTEFEGIEGLTRAFQYAGARSVGVSLWRVDVNSTTALMQRFYQQYHAGNKKDIALQQAQIALLHDRSHQWSHPYFWAAFEIVGDWK